MPASIHPPSTTRVRLQAYAPVLAAVPVAVAAVPPAVEIVCDEIYAYDSQLERYLCSLIFDERIVAYEVEGMAYGHVLDKRLDFPPDSSSASGVYGMYVHARTSFLGPFHVWCMDPVRLISIFSFFAGYVDPVPGAPLNVLTRVHKLRLAHIWRGDIQTLR